jgi:hypothetical protein
MILLFLYNIINIKLEQKIHLKPHEDVIKNKR